MKVLVTGGSGFLGKHCLDTLLKRGHTVVTTVRSESKGEGVLKDYAAFSSQLSYTVVPDISKPGAFDTAIKASPPFEAVLHTASPFHYKAQDPKRDMIDPATHGTTEILKAVKKGAPSVKRVVITSSFASVMNPAGGVSEYTAKDWNPITMEQALSGGMMTYVGSKKFAEKAAWDFMEAEKPAFTLATINPVLIFGPITYQLKSLNEVNTSNQVFADILLGKMKNGIDSYAFKFVDVRDVAIAHVRALEVEEAGGQRFLMAGGPYSNEGIALIIQKHFPEVKDKLPEKIEVPETPSFKIDTTPAQNVLGIKFTPLEQSVVDTVKSLLNFKV